jgi:hypothetical protein
MTVPERRGGEGGPLWSGGARLSGLAGALPPLVLPAGPPRRPPLSPLTLSPSPRVSSGTGGLWGGPAPGAASPRGLSFAGRSGGGGGGGGGGSRGSGASAGGGISASAGGAASAGAAGAAAAASQSVCVVLQIRPMSESEWAEGCEQLLRVAPDGSEVRCTWVGDSRGRGAAHAYEAAVRA